MSSQALLYVTILPAAWLLLWTLRSARSRQAVLLVTSYALYASGVSPSGLSRHYLTCLMYTGKKSWTRPCWNFCFIWLSDQQFRQVLFAGYPEGGQWGGPSAARPWGASPCWGARAIKSKFVLSYLQSRSLGDGRGS